MSKQIKNFAFLLIVISIYSIFFAKNNIFDLIRLKKKSQKKQNEILKLEYKMNMINDLNEMFAKNTLNHNLIDEFLKEEFDHKKQNEILINLD